MSLTPTLQTRITALQLEHRELDIEIDNLMAEADGDELKIRRLKKRKLQLKDSITLLQMQLTPDIPA
jgi:hypothetical protein